MIVCIAQSRSKSIADLDVSHELLVVHRPNDLASCALPIQIVNRAA